LTQKGVSLKYHLLAVYRIDFSTFSP